jgi:nucleoside-diphosphate-sugar epimerase
MSDSDRVWAVYGASKTQGEQAAWQFVKDNNPHFTVNTVLPNANLGPVGRAGAPQVASSLAWD